MRSWSDGWRRVFAAPAVIAGVFVVTLLAALPLALSLRAALQDHLGASLMAGEAADAVNYDWWQEFASQATGLGSTFTPSIIGFATTLDSVSGLLDKRVLITPIAWALGVYLAAWIFLSGGILDRYARRRRIGAHGFFAASGTFFFRFLRLGIAAGHRLLVPVRLRARVAVHEVVRQRDARPVGRAHGLLLAAADVRRSSAGCSRSPRPCSTTRRCAPSSRIAAA